MSDMQKQKILKIRKEGDIRDLDIRALSEEVSRMQIKHPLVQITISEMPDKQKKATETVLDQATLLCKDWAESII